MPDETRLRAHTRPAAWSGLAKAYDGLGRSRRPMKLILETERSVAVVECDCGGRALVMTKGVTEVNPSRVTCPMCHRTFDYPNDVEK